MSNIPSQAITRNSSSSVISWVVTSGYAVTICCSGDRSGLFLNSKSPNARDRARLPLTRPKSTKPPAALILAFSPVQMLEMKEYNSDTPKRARGRRRGREIADLHSAVYDRKRVVSRDL